MVNKYFQKWIRVKLYEKFYRREVDREIFNHDCVLDERDSYNSVVAPY